MKQHKIRQIASNGDVPVYGIAIPKEIAEENLGVFFNFSVSGNSIILTSGANIQELRRHTPRFNW